WARAVMGVPFRRVRVSPTLSAGADTGHRDAWSVETAAGLPQVARGAQGFVGDVQSVDRHLIAREDEPVVDPAPVEHRLAAAAADRLELLERVGRLQQARGSGEGLRAEIRA